MESFQRRYLTEARQDTKMRRKIRVFESQWIKEKDLVLQKYAILVHRGRNAEGVGTHKTAMSVGGQNYRRKDLLKLSRNLLFDSGSIEDLKKFSNMPNIAQSGDEVNTSVNGYSNIFNKYK